MTALVACEALGFFATWAAAHRKAIASRKSLDVGTYICQAITQFFPKGSRFKHVDKILADNLRHALVHGFGSRADVGSFDVLISVMPFIDTGVGVTFIGTRPAIAIDAVRLGQETVLAFDNARKALIKNSSLAQNFIQAKSFVFPVPPAVSRQFMAFCARVLPRSLRLKPDA
jgi:hypothetical protein